MLERKGFFGSNSSTPTMSETSSDKWNRILSGTEITGNIVSDSNLIIEGLINGNVTCSGKVHVGTTGRIAGNLSATNAEFEGSQEGELSIDNLLILRSTARIKGNINTLKLNIEEGAFFEGACVMKSPVSSANFAQSVSFE
jgi:cytoskeletal protein CcmA (bactofilin family)